VDKPNDAPDSDGKDFTPVVVNGTLFYPVGEHGRGRKITVIKDADKRQWAGATSKSLGVLSAGTDVTTYYWCLGEKVDGESVWWVLGKDINEAARLWAGVTDSRPA
jgi:hypothetical protein